MRQVEVRHPFAIAEPQRLQFPGTQDVGEGCFVEPGQTGAYLRLRQVGGVERAPMVFGDAQETFEEFARLRTAANGEKVDQLDEEPGSAAARSAHRAGESPQAVDVTVVADS